MAKSILQNDKECYLCRRMYNLCTTRGLEEHHILFGRGRRELSEQYGLKVWLCHRHHNEPPEGVHFNAATSDWLKGEAQKTFEWLYGHDRWMKEVGKDYLSCST